MSIRCMIVDDEPLARQLVREFLQKHPDIEIVDESGNPREAFQKLIQKKPELLILDIQMPEMNGFELLQLLPEKPTIIFCTAYDEYAIQAFEANAVDYLLKPFDQQRFDQALEKVRHYLTSQQFHPQLEQLLQYLRQQKKPLERFVVRKGNHLKIIHADDILWFEAVEDYIRIHTHREQFLILQRMRELEQQLDNNHFVRIHRSSIVNLDAVDEIHPWSSGRFLLKLKNGQELKTSRSGAKRMREIIQ